MPVWGIKSVGETVATRDTLSIDKVVLEIGFVGQQEIKFRFEHDDCCNMGGSPVRFLGGQADAACTTVGAVPTKTVECVYTRDIPQAQDEEFSFSLPISRPPQIGRPAIRMTVFVADLSLSSLLIAKRVKPEADLVVTTGGPVQGRVGDVVAFDWTVTNVGLDPVWERSGIVAVTAPAGTEFVDWEAIVADPDIICFAPSATPTFRQCWFAVIEPGAAKAHKQTWKVKILSPEVGEGKVTASLGNSTGAQPEGDYVDPTPADNTAPIRIEVLVAVPSSGGGQLPSQLPTTGTRTVVEASIGGLALALAGALLILAARRRRTAQAGLDDKVRQG